MLQISKIFSLILGRRNLGRNTPTHTTTPRRGRSDPSYTTRVYVTISYEIRCVAYSLQMGSREVGKYAHHTHRVCCVSHNLSLLQIRDWGVDLSRFSSKCANRKMRNSQFVLEEAPNLGVALLEQEIGSCPLRANTRVSIPRSVELGDSSLSHRVALPGRRAFELRN